MTERRIDCPFKDHSSKKSMAINEDKGFGYCHACDRGWALEIIEATLNGDIERMDRGRDTSTKTDVVDVAGGLDVVGGDLPSDFSLVRAVAGYLPPGTYPNVDWGPIPDDEINDPVYQGQGEGYARFYSLAGGSHSDRWMGPAPGKGPRFRSTGSDVFWATDHPTGKGEVVFLVEGVGDALALKSCGASCVAACLGKDLSDRKAFDLRDTFPIIIFDADSSGYLGSRKAKEKLLQFSVPSVILDLPKSFGDIREAVTNQREIFLDWFQAETKPFLGKELTYVQELFSGQAQPLMTISTQIDWINQTLKGGLKGCNVIAGTPGAGKSCLMTKLCVDAARNGYRVLLVPLELSKMQSWARVASTHPDAPEWALMEAQPTLLPEHCRGYVEGLAENLHIRVGMSLERILQVGRYYDMVVVDYLQRLPEIEKAGEEHRTSSVGNAVKRLANLSRDENKVVFAVSSMPRASYTRKDMSIFKESGDIEYVVSGAFLIEGEGDHKILHNLKNTRGDKGHSALLQADLGHCTFMEAR